MRNVRSIYQRAKSKLAAVSDGAEGSSERRRVRSRGATWVPSQEEEEEQQQEEEAQEEAQDEEQEEDEMEEARESTTGSAASASSCVYLQDPATLPKRPIPLARRPVIRTDGKK
jgi:hypothetical protein